MQEAITSVLDWLKENWQALGLFGLFSTIIVIVNSRLRDRRREERKAIDAISKQGKQAIKELSLLFRVGKLDASGKHDESYWVSKRNGQRGNFASSHDILVERIEYFRPVWKHRPLSRLAKRGKELAEAAENMKEYLHGNVDVESLQEGDNLYESLKKFVDRFHKLL